MPKRKNVGDFNQIPLPIDKQKPGDLLSIGRTRKAIDLPGNACDYTPSDDLPNLDIIRPQGRSQGTLITYSANQIYNYQSQSERYDKSIDEIPAYVTDNGDGTITYGYCSHGSQKGFWEVVVGDGGQATFININPQFLTILCPRPFQADELIVINTDSEVFSWSQIAGSRTVLISPADAKYPLIDIQASCFTGGCTIGTTSPIILRVETDNELVFADLVIFNRPTDFFYGGGFSVLESAIEGRKVVRFYRVPDNTHRAFVWTGEDILVTWLAPVLDSEFIVLYRVQRLVPPYTDNESFLPTDERIATIQSNSRYRVAADYNIYGALTTSYSNPLFFNFPVANRQTIYADDAADGMLGFLFVSNAYTKLELGGQVRYLTDYANGMLGYAFISNEYSKLTLGAQILTLTDDANTGLGYALISNAYVKIDLGGVIIG